MALLLGGSTSIAMFLLARRIVDQDAQRYLERESLDRATVVRRSLQTSLNDIESTRLMWENSQEVTREEFGRFVNNVMARNESIEAVFWIAAPPAASAPVGSEDERSQFSARAWPEPSGPYSVLHAVERDGRDVSNALDALGGEFLSTLRGHQYASLRTREPFQVVGPEDSTRVWWCFPVWAPLGESDASGPMLVLSGLLIGGVRLDRLLHDALHDLAPQPIDIFLSSFDARHSRTIVRALPAPTRPDPGAAQLSPELALEPRRTFEFSLAGSNWRLVCAPAAPWQPTWNGLLEWILLGIGLAMTVMLTSLLTLREARADDLEVAHEMTKRAAAERQRADQALLESEERFRAMFERHDSMMFLVDPSSGQLIDANPSAERFYGYSRAEFRSLTVFELNGLPRAEVDLLLRAAIGERRNYFVVPHKLKNGELRKVELHSSPVDFLGRRVLFSILHDVTDREESQQRVVEGRRMESLGVLAGGVAHDFNNLLTAIIGNIELALQRAAGHDALRGPMFQALAAARRASDLTRNLLTYAGQGNLERRAVDCARVVREALDLVRPNLAPTLVLEFQARLPLPDVEVDPAEVQQLAVNLVLNAAEACARQGGRIAVELESIELDRPPDGALEGAAEFRPGRYVCLRIRDDGEGMDEATRARIFDPFFSTRFAGRGLGLAAVLGIVRAHRGALTVQSAPGAGSRFDIWLPCVQPAQDTQEAQGAPV